jgi:hypothetical protein
MATKALNTTFKGQGNRISVQAYEYVEVPVAAAAGTVVTIAPADGKLKRAYMVAGSLHNATNNYITMLMANKSNSDAAMFGANDTGDGTDTAAYGKRVLVLSSTSANLKVDEGDWLELTTTVQGTVGAATKVVLVYEVD